MPITDKISKVHVAPRKDNRVDVVISLERGISHEFTLGTSDALNLAQSLIKQSEIAIAYQKKH